MCLCLCALARSVCHKCTRVQDVEEHLDGDSKVAGTHGNIGVRRGPVHVADDQEGHLVRARHVEHGVAFLLDGLAVHQRDLAPVKVLDALLVDTENRGVSLQEHGFASPNCL